MCVCSRASLKLQDGAFKRAFREFGVQLMTFKAIFFCSKWASAASGWPGRRSQPCHLLTQSGWNQTEHVSKYWIANYSIFQSLRSNFQKPTSKNLQCAVLQSWMLLICRKLHWLPTAGSCRSLCDTRFCLTTPIFSVSTFKKRGKKRAACEPCMKRFIISTTTNRQRRKKERKRRGREAVCSYGILAARR